MPSPQYREAAVGEWWGTELQLTKHLWDRLTLTLGGEYRDDFRQQLELLDAVTGARVGTSTRTNRQNYGVYLEGDFAVLSLAAWATLRRRRSRQAQRASPRSN